MTLAAEEGCVTFTVLGTPFPQGSKKAFARGGRAWLVNDNDGALKDWRVAVATFAQAAYMGPALDGALYVEVEFRLKRPKIAKRKRWSDKKPDIDKLLRSTFDGMTDAGVIADDSRISIVRSEKVYATSEDAWTGARISVAQLVNDL